MITCQHLQKYLFAIASGDLAPSRREEVEQHLHACAHCAWEVETYVQTIRLARQLPPLRPPARLLERFRRALAEERVQAQGEDCLPD